MPWYVIISKNGRTWRASNELEERGFETFAPIERGYRWNKGRKHKTEAPLLGRYFFASIPDENGFHRVTSAPDVFAILSDENGPRPLDARWVDAYRAAEADGDFDKTLREDRAFIEGGRVVVNKAPFKGHIGELIRRKGHQRWTVFLEGVFGGSGYPADVTETEMEPVEGKAA